MHEVQNERGEGRKKVGPKRNSVDGRTTSGDKTKKGRKIKGGAKKKLRRGGKADRNNFSKRESRGAKRVIPKAEGEVARWSMD